MRPLDVILSAACLWAWAAGPACACVGDCNEDGVVSIDELVLCTDIALRSRPTTACPLADANDNGRIAIDEVVQAVGNTLNGCPAESIPTTAPELLAWLQAGNYLDWTRESGLHPPVGPHQQQVLTYFNDPLFASLAAENASHPAGAAAVKELYNRGDLVGWAAMIKTEDDSDGGRGWYWYERIGTSITLSGFGHPACIGCHGSDQGPLISKDFVLSPYPLQ